MIRSALALVALTAVSTAQVRVVTALAPPVAATVEGFVRERLGGQPVQLAVRSTSDLWDSALFGRPIDADVVAGVDAQVVELMAAEDLLERLDPTLPDGVAPFHVDAGGRYVVPWADAWGIVSDATAAGTAPRTLDALGADAMAGRLAVPAPEAAPSLLVAWVRTALRDGESSDEVFARLTAIDARLPSWCDPAEDALRVVGDGGFAVATRSAVHTAGGTLAFEPLAPFVPLTGLAVAATREAGDPAAARAVVEALLDPALARRLAIEHRLLPGLTAERRAGAPPVPDELVELVAAASPVEPDAGAHVREWILRFESDVRGRGHYSEVLGTVLDVVFLALFLGAMVWIYRRSQAGEG